MQFYHKEAELWTERKQTTIEHINEMGLPLVLFGKAAVVNRAFLDGIKVPMKFICDNATEKWGTQLWGLTVISPDELEKHYTAYNVLILVPFEDQIVPQLQQLPVPPCEIFRLDLYFEEGVPDYFTDKQELIADISKRLADPLSRETFEAVIRYRINRNRNYLEGISLPRNQQYFPKTLNGQKFLHNAEVFVDAGAFIGDTVEAFLDVTNKKYQAIYAFEPDINNFKQLLRSTEPYKNIYCENIGTGACKQQLSFCSDDSGSKVDNNGESMVQIDALDVLLCDVPITFLKMDVEGMECAALRGAQGLIKRYRPKLAICTYHSNADMLEVPKLIWDINPDYQLYFRHYSNALVETVCYAI